MFSSAHSLGLIARYIMLGNQLLGHALEVPLAHFLESIPNFLFDELFRLRNHTLGIISPMFICIPVCGGLCGLGWGNSQIRPGVGFEEGCQERQRGKRRVVG
jgi:hypothetical protein